MTSWVSILVWSMNWYQVHLESVQARGLSANDPVYAIRATATYLLPTLDSPYEPIHPALQMPGKRCNRRADAENLGQLAGYAMPSVCVFTLTHQTWVYARRPVNK